MISGGFDEPEDLIQNLKVDDTDFQENLIHEIPDLFTGINFASSETKTEQEKPPQIPDTIDLLAIIDQGDIFEIEEKSNKKVEVEKPEATEKIELKTTVDESLLEIKSQSDNVLKIKDTQTKVFTEWAELIDISKPVHNFHQKITDMAHHYEFELDTFQKNAILKLEDHEHVFVAAHTSGNFLI